MIFVKTLIREMRHNNFIALGSIASGLQQVGALRLFVVYKDANWHSLRPLHLPSVVLDHFTLLRVLSLG